MFQTLELQNLNKLVKGEVGDFSAPKAFHAVKVQRLGSDKVKPSTQVGRQFVVPIASLIVDMPIQACELTDTPPPVVRTFKFARKAFVERSELFQGLLQELWTLYLLTGVEREKSVFHTEVCTYTFTRSRQDFFRGVVGCDIKPIRTNGITKDLDVADVSCPIAVVVEREPTFVEFQGFRGFIPRLKRQTNTSFSSL